MVVVASVDAVGGWQREGKREKIEAMSAEVRRGMRQGSEGGEGGVGRMKRKKVIVHLAIVLCGVKFDKENPVDNEVKNLRSLTTCL